MKKPTPTEFANAFLWLAVLAAASILFWDCDRLWMMIVALVVNGWASMGLVAKCCRERLDAL
jgi:hypothetical protein